MADLLTLKKFETLSPFEIKDELIKLAKRAAPFRLGPVLDVDTTAPQDINAISAWAKRALAQANR